MSKDHYDFIARHYEVIEANVWLYHVSYSEKKGLRVKIANGDVCKSQNTKRAFDPTPYAHRVFFEYSNDGEHKYCNKVSLRNNDGTERLDICVFDVRDDDMARNILINKYKNERDRIAQQFNQKIEGIYDFFNENKDECSPNRCIGCKHFDDRLYYADNSINVSICAFGSCRKSERNIVSTDPYNQTPSWCPLKENKG